MSTLDAETMGPVDVAVVRFPAGQDIDAAVSAAIHSLVDDGTVQVVDLTVVETDADGGTAIRELVDTETGVVVDGLVDDQFDLLSEEDLHRIGSAAPPGSSSLVIVWANTWSARLAGVIRESGGTLVEFDRVPHDQLVAAIAALEAPTAEEE